MSRTERQTQAEIIDTFGRLPWLRITRYQVGKFMDPTCNRIVSVGVKGWPDLIGFLNDGRFLAIEVKGPQTRISEPQRAFARTAERFGLLYVLARSVDDVWKALKDEGYPK